MKKTSLGYFGKRSQESSFFPLLPHPPVGEERTSQPMAIAKSREVMEILRLEGSGWKERAGLTQPRESCLSEKP